MYFSLSHETICTNLHFYWIQFYLAIINVQFETCLFLKQDSTRITSVGSTTIATCDINCNTIIVIEITLSLFVF